MTQEKDSKDKISGLRKRAEESVDRNVSDTGDITALSPDEVQRMVHELRVHQIELEMQNEDLRQAQVKLEELKDRYLDLYDFAPVGYVTVNDKGLILEANLTAVRLLGVERQTLISRPFSRFVCKEFGDAYYLYLQKVFETQSQHTSETKLVREDGAQFFAQLESVAEQDESGEFSRCRTMVSDITDRKEAEDELLKSVALLKEAQRTANIGHWELDHPDGTPTWSEEIFHIFGLDPAKGEPSFAAHRDIIHPEDWELLDRSVRELSSQGEHFDIEFRLIHKDKNIHWMHAVGYPTKNDAGEVIRLFGTAQDITKRKQVEDLLRQSEERNRFLAEVIENSSQPFGVGYPDGRLGIVNRAFCDLTGYSEEELRQLEWNLTLTPPEWLESEMQHLAELERTGKPVRYEKEYIRKDGTRVPIELLVHVVRGETGEPLHYQSFLTDLTDRKKSEDALRESENRFRSMFQNHDAAMLLIDPKSGQIMDANRSAQRFYGYQMPELLGMSIQQINALSPDEIARERQKAMSRERSHFIFPHRLANGDVRTVDVHSSPIDLEGQRILFSIVYDITDRKKAEEALKESEQRYRAVIDNVEIGISLLNSKMEIVAVNNAMKKNFPHVRPGCGQICYEQYNDPPNPEPCSYCPCVLTLQDGEVHEAITETPSGRETRVL